MRFLSTVPWAQRLRTCCTDRLIIEWSAPSALIVPAGRQRGAPGGAARRVSQAASSPPGRHRGALAGEAWAAGGTAAPAQGPRRAAGTRHATRPRSHREARGDRQPAGAGRETRLIAGTRDEAAAAGRGTCRPPAARPSGRRHSRSRPLRPRPPRGARMRVSAPLPRLPGVSGCARALPPLRVRAALSTLEQGRSSASSVRPQWGGGSAAYVTGATAGPRCSLAAPRKQPPRPSPSPLRAPGQPEPVSWACWRAGLRALS